MTSRTINWQAIWQSLDWDDKERQEQAMQERLHQRAQQYARPSKQQESFQSQQSNTYHLLTFELGKEHYGIDVSVVSSVRSLNKITRVPGAPHFYRGVVNVRGKIITVLDLRLLLSLKVETNDLPPELIIVSYNNLEIALLVDHVSDVENIPISTIEPIEMTYMRGVTPDRLVVLDAMQLLTDDRLFVDGVDQS